MMFMRGGRGDLELRDEARGQAFDWGLARRALSAFRPYLWASVATLTVIVAASVLGSFPPLLVKDVIDRGIGGKSLHAVVVYTALTLAIAVASGLLGVLQNWLANVVGQAVMADYRSQLFRHMHRQPLRYFTESQSGQLVSRIINDVGAIQNVVTGTLVNAVTSATVILSTLVIMLALNWQLTVLALLVLPAFVVPTQRAGRASHDLQRRIQQVLARMTSQLTETLGVSGALLVKSFAREEMEGERFDRANLELRVARVQQSLVGRWLFTWLGLFSAVGPALLYGFGGWLVIEGRLSLGTVVAFAAYLNRLYMPASQVAQLHVNVMTSLALFRRIYEILDREPEIRDGPVVLDPAAVHGAIDFQGVSFTYGPELAPALRDVDLSVEAGRVVALVGPSGAGKTTLMGLVSRLHDPTAGRVTLDGRDLRELTQASLRSAIGLVSQEPFLFHDTLRANLLYARPDATDEEIVAACQAAQIHETIAAMPQAYETIVGERGYRLSGGEKQRVAIARVLLRAPRIVLLDEATSSLDTLAERRIQAALEHLLAGRTALIIAHRLSTVLAADRIVVLEQGRVVAVGRHAELLAAGGLYARLYREQFETGAPAGDGEDEAGQRQAADDAAVADAGSYGAAAGAAPTTMEAGVAPVAGAAVPGPRARGGGGGMGAARRQPGGGGGRMRVGDPVDAPPPPDVGHALGEHRD